MVKKLYKHEFKAYLRVWIPVQIIVLTIALLARGIQFLESDNIAYDMINASSVLACTLAVGASCAFTFVFAVIRFYKNLFTAEGYLSFTLPVSPTTHILTKLFTAMAFQLATVAVAILALSVLTAGDVFYEVVKAVIYLVSHLPEKVQGHLPFYVIEVLGIMLISLATDFMLYYTCLAVGQLGKKNRILLAVGVFFGYYLVSQAFGTAVSTVFTVLATLPMFVDPLNEFIQTYIYELTHVGFCGSLLWSALLGTVYAFITRYILRHRLNLE